MPETDEEIVRNLLHRYTEGVEPATSVAAGVAARQHRRDVRRRVVAGAVTTVALGTVAGVIAVVPGHSVRTKPSAAAAPSAATAVASPVKSASPAKSAAPTATAAAPRPLVLLASKMAAEPAPAGDATLIERSTTLAGQPTVSVWDLYADDGRYFFSQTEDGLPSQVSGDITQGGNEFKNDVAAALYAVNGNLDSAALKMAWAADTGPAPAWLTAQLKDLSVPSPDGAQQLDNYVWENSQDALIAGSGNPQVRAGVLRLLSVLPDITVTHSTVHGQPALTISAGASEVGAGGPTAYHETLTINADTGIPLSFAGGVPGHQPDTSVDYTVTRVSLSDIAAGKL